MKLIKNQEQILDGHVVEQLNDAYEAEGLAGEEKLSPAELERILWVLSLEERDYREARSAVEDIQESGDYPDADV